MNSTWCSIGCSIFDFLPLYFYLTQHRKNHKILIIGTIKMSWTLLTGCFELDIKLISMIWLFLWTISLISRAYSQFHNSKFIDRVLKIPEKIKYILFLKSVTFMTSWFTVTVHLVQFFFNAVTWRPSHFGINNKMQTVAQVLHSHMYLWSS